MEAKIRKTKFGYQYALRNDSAWHYFPDTVESIDQMKGFFRAGGHSDVNGQFDEPELIFVDQQNKPAKLFTIRRNARSLGQRFAVVDHDTTKKLIFDPVAIIDLDQQLQLLQTNSTREVEREAEAIEDKGKRIQFYLKHASDEAKTEFQKLIDENMTDEVLTDLCKQNALSNGMSAQVEIID
jgi:hypothetical protein